MSRLIIALAEEHTYTMVKTSGNKEDKKRLNETRPLPEQIYFSVQSEGKRPYVPPFYYEAYVEFLTY